MKFLDESDIITELLKLIKTSKKVRIAVAFWGSGGIEQIELLKRSENTEVICNLRSGGTNPAVIKTMMAAGLKVRQCDNLHGKAFLFDDCCIVGSSNVSTNGLSMQGGEIKGWREANILTEAPAMLADLSNWYDSLNSRVIEDDDLKAADEAWSRRRRLGSPPTWPKEITLIDAARRNPIDFQDRRIFLCAFSTWFDEKGEEALRDFEAKNERGDSKDLIDAFQDWPELPDDASLVSFYVGPRGGVAFDGFFEMPRTRIQHPFKDTNLTICFKIKKINGIDSEEWGTKEQWRQPLLRYRNDENWSLDKGGIIDLGEFAQKYLLE